MKRLLLIVAFIFLATAAFAEAIDRDVLITPDGTVYSILSERSENGLTATLTLTAQAGGKTTRAVLPETVDNGVNGHATLAYDAESKTLLAVWLRMPNAMSSELLVAAYRDGKWQKAISIDDKPYALRYNLSVGITRRVQQLQKDGSLADIPALVLHAVWYEEGLDGETARYAVMGLDKGTITTPDIHDLTDFVDADGAASVADNAVSHSFLRHVALLDGPTPNAVDVLFADRRTNTFYRTTLRPIADVRIRIPVGAKPGGPHIGGPKALSADWTGRTGTIASRDGKTLIFSNATDDKLRYVKYSDGKWSALQEVALSDTVTADAAMSALAKMVRATE
jgi:hypothetical protein